MVSHMNFDQFWLAIAQNTALRYLDISHSGALSPSMTTYFGCAIAFNARNNGCLEYLYCEGVKGMTMDHISNAMCITNAQYENCFGDKLKAKEMEGEDLRKVFENNLKVFQFNRTNQHRGFDIKVWERSPEDKRKDPKFVKFLS